MNFLSSRTRARMASCALAGAVWLSASSLPLQAQADGQTLTQVTTAQGETVNFAQLQDGSVIAYGSGQASSGLSGVRQAATPVDLYNELSQGQQAPSPLVTAQNRFVSQLHSASPFSRGRVSATASQPPGRPAAQPGSSRGVTLQASRHRLGPTFNGPGPVTGCGSGFGGGSSSCSGDQQWFINAFCNPPGVAYNLCYTSDSGPAFLNGSGVSVGHAVAYAIDQQLQLNVTQMGSWSVLPGWFEEVWFFGSFSNFNVSVASGGQFDFEGDLQ